MSKHKTPQEKKMDRRQRDFITESEYPHGFRTTWPRKKARVNRAFRSKVRQLASKLRETGDHLDEVESKIKGTRRKKLKKWPVTPFPKWVQKKLEDRAAFVGWNYFKHGSYSALTVGQKTRFLKFFDALISGNGIQAKDTARFLERTIAGDRKQKEWLAREFLVDFFRAEPAWKKRLESWIARQLR